MTSPHAHHNSLLNLVHDLYSKLSQKLGKALILNYSQQIFKEAYSKQESIVYVFESVKKKRNIFTPPCINPIQRTNSGN